MDGELHLSDVELPDHLPRLNRGARLGRQRWGVRHGGSRLAVGGTVVRPSDGGTPRHRERGEDSE